MISSVARWRCKCGISLQAVTETDKARINDDVRLKAACPKCGYEQLLYAHRLIELTAERPAVQSSEHRQRIASERTDALSA